MSDHWHWAQRPCTDYMCPGRLNASDGMIPWGPINGMNHIVDDLIRHFEIDPDEHDGLALEVEMAIGDEMLTIMRDILAERRIPIPVEVDALPAIPEKRTARKRGSGTTGSKPGGKS